MQVLVINCGSSSVKYQLIDLDTDERVLIGKIDKIGEPGGECTSHEVALQKIVSECQHHGVEALGHRVVHGGEQYIEAVLIDEKVIAEIDRCAVDAPLHNPYNLLGIRIGQSIWPSLPHVAVFDTAFHARMPRRARSYAIDHNVAATHRIRRFGFHGTSHQYVAGVAARSVDASVSDLRIITLHLGNGASACAVEYGQSTETSMGMTPLEGLVMGTRAGDIDAGALLSLLRTGEFDVEQIDEMLNRRSGLKGLSGHSNDLRELEVLAEEGDDRAQLAINVFAHRARKYIGAYAAAMGGVDAVVFTGGIGENSATMRRRILQRLEFLGLRLDEDRNRSAQVSTDCKTCLVSEDHSRVKVVVVKTDEEYMIALQARRIADQTHLIQSNKTIPIAVSARHLHLTEETFKSLFGANASPTKDRDISQPGQYACVERVNLIGPRNRIDGVRLLGPLRRVDQIEIARTDEFKLGVDAPIRDSGSVEGSAPIILEGPAGTVHLKQGLICARRHIHMHSTDAAEFGVVDKEVVEVAINGGPRDLSFGDVLVRVSDKYSLEMHIDTDEANAAELHSGADGELVYENAPNATAVLRSSRS